MRTFRNFSTFCLTCASSSTPPARRLVAKRLRRTECDECRNYTVVTFVVTGAIYALALLLLV